MQLRLRVMSMEQNVERGVSDLQGIGDFNRSTERGEPNATNRILSTMANERRRAILEVLTSEPDRTIEYDALVERVAERVRDDDADGVPDEHRKRVRIALHHTHLPKLAAARMVDYGAETGTVQFVGGDLEQDILALLRAHDFDE